MKHRDRRLFWGIFLVLVGFVLLLRQLGLVILGWNFFWPLVLIGFGLWILLQARRGPQVPMETRELTIPLEAAERARVQLNHGAGRLRVDGSAPADALLHGTFGGGVEERVRRESGGVDVDLRTPSGNQFAWPWVWGRQTLDWSVALSREVDLELELKTGANETRLDLTDLRVTDLLLSTGASSTVAQLPANAGHTRVRIELGAASVSLRVPPGVSGRIRVEAGISGVHVDGHRFPKSGNVYQSPDYDTAQNRVDIVAHMGAGSLEVR